MVSALLRALFALATPPLWRIMGIGLALSASTFALLWLAVAAVLYRTAFFAWRPLDWLVDALGGVTILALSWLLFPAVATLFLGFFVDQVAAAVEAADYPGKGPARHQPWGEAAGAALRLGMVTLALNLLALPLYLLVPGINCVLFLTLNGYLFGRGYFETVALRRLDSAGAERVRRRFAGRLFLGGIVIAGLFAIPLVNLVAPVIATAFMVHVFEALPGGAPHSGVRSAV